MCVLFIHIHMSSYIPLRFSLISTRISFNALLSACAGASLWTRALELLEQMTSCAVEPGSITRNVVPGCGSCRAGAFEWLVLFEKYVFS